MTSEEIERLRMDERLKVVRGLEDNTMKSACRRVNSDHLESNAIIGIILETFHRLHLEIAILANTFQYSLAYAYL